MTKAPFALSGRNPDVLSCIANLSSDEVFTPPGLADQMLDMVAEAWAASNAGESIWSNSQVTFLDPCTKTGVFLREIVKRLVDGLADEITSLEDRVDHILTKQVFGAAITELTSLLTRRTIYCSKYADGVHSVAKSFSGGEGNIWFERTDHDWVKSTGKCRYCGASQDTYKRDVALETHAYPLLHTSDVRRRVSEAFGDNMQFDVIIGNPPYQLSDGGYGTSAGPIYQHFVDRAKELDPRFLSLVIPARWFAGGKGLDEFRERFLADRRLRVIHDYWQVGDVFPGVAVQGGILYFLWNRDQPGECEVTTHYAGKALSTSRRPLLEPGADVFIRFNEAVPILKKIAAAEGGEAGSVLLPPGKRLAELVSSRKPFGLDTAFKVRLNRREGDVAAYWNGGPGFKQGGKGWTARADVTAGHQLIDRWKVFVGRAYGDRGGGGASRDAPPRAVLGRPFVGEPGSVSTETYIAVGPLDSEAEANNLISYISCKLTRFLVLLHKPSQDATRKAYTFVPRQDFTKPWTDAELYAKYGLTEEEIAFVEWMIRPMSGETALWEPLDVDD
jgi:hypothetical protein